MKPPATCSRSGRSQESKYRASRRPRRRRRIALKRSARRSTLKRLFKRPRKLNRSRVTIPVQETKMAVHHANIFKSMKDIRFEDTISHQCGITMNDSVEARAIAEVMEKKKGVTVTYMPSMIRIDGDPKLEFKMDEIAEALGRPMTPHLFEISTSTHYGRMVMVDDNTVVCFGNMDEALVYIEH